MRVAQNAEEIPALVREALERISAGETADACEGERLDFKAAAGPAIRERVRDVADALACFANAAGGTVVVGVADRQPGPGAFSDCGLDPDQVRLDVHRQTVPPLVAEVACFTWEGAQLLRASTPPSPVVHAVSGRSTERVGKACMPMSPARIADVASQRRGEDWSGLDSGVPHDAVDAEALALARALLARIPDPARAAWARASDADLLRNLGVVTADLRLTRAGVLLLTARHGVGIAYSYRRTPSGTLAANEILAPPLLRALVRVLELIEARTEQTSVNLPSGQQLQVADLPQAAVREALANAVMHCDHRLTERITVEHSPTRMVVTSPGGFVSGVTVDNVLTTPSRTRNQNLAEAIRKLGLAETAGVGVDRMYAAMARAGHEPPDFETDGASVRVSLRGGAPNAALTRFAATLPPDEAEDADTMLVLLTLLSQRTVTARKLAPVLQKSTVETEAVLVRLSAEPVGLLEVTRESARRAARTYRLRGGVVAALGTAVTYRSRSGEDSDRKILGIIAEQGTVNSRVVRLMLDVDTPTASRILADLVSRDLLVKTSEASRGRSVTYGPGPLFNDWSAARRRRD